MRVQQIAQNGFELYAESAADLALLDAMDFERHVHVASIERERTPVGVGWENVGAVLIVSRTSPQALEAQAGRETLRALRQLASLVLGQSANDGLVTAAPTQPKAQEQLATGLVELQRVVDALRIQVGQVELVLKEMQGHTASVTTEKTTILAAGQGGAA